MDSKDVEEIFKGVLTDENHPNPGYQAPPPNVLPPPVPTGKMKVQWTLNYLNSDKFYENRKR